MSPGRVSRSDADRNPRRTLDRDDELDPLPCERRLYDLTRDRTEENGRGNGLGREAVACIDGITGSVHRSRNTDERMWEARAEILGIEADLDGRLRSGGRQQDEECDQAGPEPCREAWARHLVHPRFR